MALSDAWRDGAVYSQRHQISFYMLDRNGRLKPSEILRMFGSLATDDFTDLGFDYLTLLDKGYFFIVVRASVSVLRQPKDAEEVIISTWPHKVRALQVSRNFSMTTPEGESLVEAQEIYMIVSTETGRVIRMGDFPYGDVIKFSPRTVCCPPPARIKLAGEAPLLGIVRPSFDDIDGNQHVNNARYVSFVIDALPEKLQARAIEHFLLAYDGQATQGERLSLHCLSASSASSASGATAQAPDASRAAFEPATALFSAASADPELLLDQEGSLTVAALKENGEPCFGCSLSFAKEGDKS